ncbi:DUF3862 domain-containing protein [Geotalea toluenoxydans]|uniref:DUF3862 domain-containing protein n=1 Tax=Geotalea toluenoxydans TaxID=421624 RepID=UPI000A89A781|nr:DUF3862 domain-containing protein [Geotalea toluenoxydans]
MKTLQAGYISMGRQGKATARFSLLVLLIMLAVLYGCSKLTTENYEKIKMGMDYGEVAGILGKSDSCSEALFACIWGNEQKNITVNFVGDKAILFTSKNIR